MTAALTTADLATELSRLMERYGNDPLPVLNLVAHELLAGNEAGLHAWADFTNAVDMLGRLEVDPCSWNYLPDDEPRTYPERDEAVATAHWSHEKADAAEALLRAVAS